VASSSTASSAAPTTTTTAPKNKPEITMGEYEQIQNGMTYEQVVEIVGGPGESISENEIAGIKTAIYSFKGDSFGSNATITVQNGKVFGKAQLGLK
jgi:hypothetical protein